MKDWLKENWSKISVVSGVFITILNILDFQFGGCPLLLPGGCEEHYFYATEAKAYVALGISLVVAGLLFEKCIKR